MNPLGNTKHAPALDPFPVAIAVWHVWDGPETELWQWRVASGYKMDPSQNVIRVPRNWTPSFFWK